MPTAPTHLLASLPGPEDLGRETIRAAHPLVRVVAAADLLDLRRNSQHGLTTFISTPNARLHVQFHVWIVLLE
jgi:hypothetical protein